MTRGAARHQSIDLAAASRPAGGACGSNLDALRGGSLALSECRFLGDHFAPWATFYAQNRIRARRNTPGLRRPMMGCDIHYLKRESSLNQKEFRLERWRK